MLLLFSPQLKKLTSDVIAISQIGKQMHLRPTEHLKLTEQEGCRASSEPPEAEDDGGEKSGREVRS